MADKKLHEDRNRENASRRAIIRMALENLSSEVLESDEINDWTQEEIATLKALTEEFGKE